MTRHKSRSRSGPEDNPIMMAAIIIGFGALYILCVIVSMLITYWYIVLPVCGYIGYHLYQRHEANKARAPATIQYRTIDKHIAPDGTSRVHIHTKIDPAPAGITDHPIYRLVALLRQ